MAKKHMNDAELKAHWATIAAPVDALRALSENRTFLGDDPYYRDLDTALWEMVDRVIALVDNQRSEATGRVPRSSAGDMTASTT